MGGLRVAAAVGIVAVGAVVAVGWSDVEAVAVAEAVDEPLAVGEPATLAERATAGRVAVAEPATVAGPATVTEAAAFAGPATLPAARRRVAATFQDFTTEECLLCHAEADVVEMAEVAPRDGLIVDPGAYGASVHGDFDCVFCHEDVRDVPHEARLARVDPDVCAVCHDDAAEAYAPSVHGLARATGDQDAPGCAACHGMHDILPVDDEGSHVYPFALPTTCGQCHGDERIAQQHAIEVPDAYQRYVESVHGRGLLRSGLLVSAACNDCHGSHDILPADDPRSPVYPANVPATCGSCHQGILTQFSSSIHGELLAAGAGDAPSCSTCHAVHDIPSVDDDTFAAQAVAECGTCHADMLDTYRGTYHGKVNAMGFTEIAACSSCHTAHHVLPADHPDSSVAPGNIVNTCGSCHPGANGKFASYIVHADPTDFERFPVLFVVYFGMVGLLTVTLVVGTAHTALWYRRLRIEQRRLGRSYERPAYRQPDGAPEYVRFNLFNRVLHVLVMVSFMLLVVTGLPVRFAEAGWAHAWAEVFGGFRGAALIHRFGAVLMLVYVVLHLGYLVRLRAGGKKGLVLGPQSLMPSRRDWHEFVAHVRWFLGRARRPRFGRWTYWEKFDYFADAWGVMVFGVTGLILWYPVWLTNWIPGWFINVAVILHGFEALLALSFIFTVHFFNAHLRPGKFPLDPVFLTGRITLEELRDERPREYELLVDRGELEDSLVGSSSELARHYARVVGYGALAVGLLVVAVIVVTVLFALLG